VLTGPSQTSRRYGAAETLQALFDGLARGVDDHLGFPVQRVAHGEDALQIVHGVGVTGHGAQIALCQDACHVFFGTGFEPDGAAAAQQQIEGLVVRNRAAAEREDDALVLIDQAFEAAA
jgi:hypothetical protein